MTRSRPWTSRRPLPVVLLQNVTKDLPPSLVAATRRDGAGHVTIVVEVLLPLPVPTTAACGGLRFPWVWNDLLVALPSADQDAPRSPRRSRTAPAPGSVRGWAGHLRLTSTAAGR